MDSQGQGLESPLLSLIQTGKSVQAHDVDGPEKTEISSAPDVLRYVDNVYSTATHRSACAHALRFCV
jgi:hypothetical protein